MATGSGIRKKLETEYLAQSLQGHIQYYATSYSRSPDHEGRAAIRYDGNEIPGAKNSSAYPPSIIPLPSTHSWT